MPEPINAEDALYARLQAVAAVTALFGTRIYLDRAPDDAARPYCVYQIISGERDQDHEDSASLTRQRHQWDVIDSTAKGAKVGAIAIKNALHGYQGTSAGTRIDYLNAFDGPSDFSETTKAYRRIVETETLFADP